LINEKEKKLVQTRNILLGYDHKGIVFDQNDRVLRDIKAEYSSEILEIYEIYKKEKLQKYGIVETSIYSKILTKITLQHEKHLISYPYEWSANMFKDSALFHIDLLLKLDTHELTLKDALPNNILFNFSNPIFIDFLSLIKKENLSNEEWLFQIGNPDRNLQYFIFEKMFIPYFLIPLLIFARKDYGFGRALLLEFACNMGEKPPSWRSLLVKSPHKSRIKCLLEVYSWKLFLRGKKKKDFIFFYTELLQILQNIDVTPKDGPYFSYYKQKNEEYFFANKNNWGSKQKNVASILEKYKHKHVLDLGANTGWYSILAAKLGANVIATDIDESCVDFLYCYAKKNNLRILSLFISFVEICNQYFGSLEESSKYNDRDFADIPLFRSAEDRLQSDLVLCLALIHHLILGCGYEIFFVMSVLSSLSKSGLMVEYVDWEDKVIISDPSFFKNLKKHSKQTYSLEKIIEVGLKFFNSHDVLDSCPKTRKLIYFRK
jgi:SAM-dependent methyltransferase